MATFTPATINDIGHQLVQFRRLVMAEVDSEGADAEADLNFQIALGFMDQAIQHLALARLQQSRAMAR